MTTLLTTARAARRRDVDPGTVRRWCRLGQLRSIKPGHEYLIDPADLAAFQPDGPGPKPRKSEVTRDNGSTDGLAGVGRVSGAGTPWDGLQF